MLDPVRRMLTAASETKQTRDFWQAAARILSEWGGGTRVQLTYRGVQESGGVEVGTPGREGKPFVADYHDAEGRQVQAAFAALPAGFPVTDLQAAIEIATRLAFMVARRAALERERRLGTFLVELSRWMLAAPERDLLLRYTLQSVTNLLEAQGAYVALRQAGGGADTLRVASTAGRCAELDGTGIDIDESTTGRVIRTGQPVLTPNILREPDGGLAISPSGAARAAMIAPLKTSSGAVGAVGGGRYVQPGG